MIFSKFQTTPFLVIALIALLFPAFAQAYFSSDAEATGNAFTAGTLDIEVDNTSHSVGITASSNESFDFDVSETGTISPQYQLSAVPTVCTSDFYNGINVEVTQGSVIYFGPLSGLSATTSSDGLWDVVVTNDSVSAMDSETCEVDLILLAWQEEFTASSTGGFSEEITMDLTITANENMGMYALPPAVVLNEIMPNPVGDDSQNGLLGEWVELYNNTNQTIDLNGWYIKDLAGAPIVIGGTSDNLPTTENGATTIEAFGWLVVYMNAPILNNSGTETVYLYDNNDVLQNGYTYTAGSSSGNDPEDGVTPGGDNGDDDIPGTSGSAREGKSDARIPDGIGVWVDPEPTAGEANYVTREELEELGYGEQMITFLLDRQEEARQAREARELAETQPEQPAISVEEPATIPTESEKQPTQGRDVKDPTPIEDDVLNDDEIEEPKEGEDMKEDELEEGENGKEKPLEEDVVVDPGEQVQQSEENTVTKEDEKESEEKVEEKKSEEAPVESATISNEVQTPNV